MEVVSNRIMLDDCQAISGKMSMQDLKDLQSIDDLDFSKIDLQRGKTPRDIKEKCLKLCQEYMAGDWTDQTIDTIEVRRVTGGLTNQLYYCGIIDRDSESCDPQEVAIRFYGEKYWIPEEGMENDRLSDVIIGMMVSETKLGPQILGLFDQGQILRYYKHRQFKFEEQSNEKIVRKVLQNLAKIHAMNVPVKRNTCNWALDQMVRDYNEAHKKFPIDKEIDSYGCHVFKKNDFLAEVQWIKREVKRIGSPVVFTHNDYRSSNILITEPNEQLVICDFEYSCYGYRGYDFVPLMTEWGRNQFDFKSMHELPINDCISEPLIRLYVEECEQIYGQKWSQNPINSVKHILDETKVFLLVYCLFQVAVCMKFDEHSDDFPMSRKLLMQFSDMCFKNYFAIKEKLKKHKIVN